MSYEKKTILAALAQIQNNELVLPAIQRDFVWDTDRMYRLLDSIFRGYPFSTLLFWNTRQRIQYRQFTRDWTSEQRYTFLIKEEGRKGTLVLDGQQRLQTLYLALYGSYEQKILYFDLLSGLEPDDISQARYHFEYLTPAEAQSRGQAHPGAQFWIPLRDLSNLNYGQVALRSMQYLNRLGLSAETEAGQRLAHNVSTAYGVLRGDEALNYFTIDREYGDDGMETDLDAVLEIFVRVNSGGQVLSKSDLMFSLMQMLWEGAADAIAELIDRLNAKERYDFDKDFILKTALVCTNRGARYQVDKLRNETYVKEIEQSFPRIAEALLNCKDFIVSKARFLDDRILRSYNTLIPFVYFFYLQPNQQIKSEETLLRMNYALYLSLMTNLYSRFADNYIDQVVNTVLLPHHQKAPGEFPLDEYLAFMYSKQGRSELDDWLLQNNVGYVMNILEGGTRLPEGKRSRRPEVDHIFPRSRLQTLGVPDDRINHYANFRLISQPENNWKRAQDPRPYFDANPKAAPRYLIPTDLLAYDQYEPFLEKRRELIWDHLTRFFGLESRPGPAAAAARPVESQTAPAPQPAVPQAAPIPQPSALRPVLEQLLSDERKALPVLQDKTQWVDIYREAGFTPTWCGRYHSALHKAGIQNVGDFAAAVMALKLQMIYADGEKSIYKFASPLPDGAEISLANGFGGYAWKWVLITLKNRELDWKEYVVK